MHSIGMTLTEAAEVRATTGVFLRPAPESRPAAQQFSGPAALAEPVAGQPSLLDALQELIDDASAPPTPRGVVVRRDRGPGSVRPAPGLPEPASWAAVLGLAIGQVLVGARPVSQLQSWLEPAVLADLRGAVRQLARNRTAASEPPVPVRSVPIRSVPVRVRSVRVQCPTPVAVEAAIHLRIGASSLALGARLDAYGRRWLCTALARPTPVPVSAPRPDRDTT